MKKIGTVFVVLTMMVSLVSCAGEFNRGQSGAVTNGIGGVVVGYEMDKQDRQQLNNVFERGVSGQQKSWQNPNSGVAYTVTPQPATKSLSGPCRKAEIRAVLDGKPETTYLTACRSAQWVVQ